MLGKIFAVIIAALLLGVCVWQVVGIVKDVKARIKRKKEANEKQARGNEK